MATYAYLVDPENQFMTKSGTINTAGVLRVYDAATDDPVITYKDFMGTENEEAIQLDDNGRAIVIADSEKAYRLEVYDRYGTLLWTTTPLWCQAGGGGANIARTDIVSSDGTVEITKTVVGSTTTFDLSTDVDDGTDLLEWIRCDGFILHDNGCYVPEYTAGTMDIGDDGVNLYADRYYHITGHIKAVKDNVVNQPFYDDVVVHFIGHNGEDEDVEFQTYKLDVDYSMAMPQIFEVSTDILAPSDIELLIKIDNAEISGATFSLEDLSIHRVFSGAPALPGGAASKPWVYEEFQEKLTAGDGIVISEDNVISATAAQQKNADWLATSGVEEILNKPDLSIYAEKSEVAEELADKQDTLIVGDNITIIDNVISATAEPQRNADWLANSGVEEILNKPDLSIYAEKSEVAEELADKQDVLTPGSNITIENNVISATAEPQVNADWLSNSGVSEILNKPDLSVYATKEEVAEDLSDKQDVLTPGSNITIENNVISATAEPQKNADWNANSGVEQILNKPDLTQYATKTEVAEDLADYQPLLTAGDNISITNNVISAADQLNSDWEATSGVQEILNKPVVRNLIPGDNITMEDSANGVVISATAAPQVNADWDASSGVSAILNKPDLSVYATETELTTGLAGKQDNMVVLEYGTSTWADFTAAYNKNAIVYCRVSTGTNQYRLAFMAYRTQTLVEFQYVRSISTHNASQQGDQVFVYKLDSTNAWTTTTREMVLQAQAGDGITRTVSTSTGAGTISWSVKAKANGGVTVDSNGVSVTTPVPSYDSSDADKVLGVVSDGVTTALQWVQGGGGGGGGGSYSAGEGITILGEEISVKAGDGLGFDSDTEELVVNVPVPEPTSADADKVLGVTDANGSIGWVDATASQVNSDWNANSGVAQILNKPDLSQYATYTDLMSKQDTLTPGAHISIQNNVISTDVLPQVNSDWDANSGVQEILHKPDIKPLVAGTGILITEGANAVTVEATGGSGSSAVVLTYGTSTWSDFTDALATTKDIIVEETATTGTNYYVFAKLNKDPITQAITDAVFSSLGTATMPRIVTLTTASAWSRTNTSLQQALTAGNNITISNNVISATAEPQVNADWEATSGVQEILHKPDLSIYAESADLATVATTGAYSDLSGTPTLATVATSGSYDDLTDKPTINNVPAVTSSDDDKVLKASYSGGVGSYSWETAANPQVNSDWEATSGVAEILNKPDLVDIVAGPGIVVDNPDGDTLRVSADSAYETVLYSNATPEPIVTETQLNLSESYLNFERVRIYLRASGGNTVQSSYEVESQVFQSDGTELSCIPVSNGSGGLMCDSNVFVFATTATTKCTVKSSGVRLNISSTGISTTNNRGASVYKITGVHRIANN